MRLRVKLGCDYHSWYEFGPGQLFVHCTVPGHALRYSGSATGDVGDSVSGVGRIPSWGCVPC